jgi:hypothetical protein
MKHDLIINSDGKATRRPIGSFSSRLAAAMALLPRRNLDYQGLARKVFLVESLPQGALAYYEKDLDVASILGCADEPDQFKHNKYSINDQGKAGRRFIGGRVASPKFEIYSNPTIRIADIKQRPFDVIDRDVRKARQQLMSREDAAIFKALDDAGKDDKNQ